MTSAFKEDSTLDSFLIIKKENPNGTVFANLQSSASLSLVNQSIELLGASAIHLHMNSAQELLMPEGDREFKFWLENIKYLVDQVNVPIIIKEVGFGFSKESIQKLIDVGVKNIDISGRGGTNFASIENMRSKFPMDFMMDWGQSTVESLLEANQFKDQVNVIASGGIRNMLDVAKALALGAKFVGISGLVLRLVMDVGVDETVNIINEYKVQLKKIMSLLGVNCVSNFNKTDMVFDSKLSLYAKQRNLDISFFHNRTNSQ